MTAQDTLDNSRINLIGVDRRDVLVNHRRPVVEPDAAVSSLRTRDDCGRETTL
jgi:hypothetical protein